ncbi:MAG: SPFH domain-containing protein, partial [bacterium]
MVTLLTILTIATLSTLRAVDVVGWWGFPIVLIALFFLLFRFTIVSEGTAKAITRFGACKKIVVAWEKHELDDDAEVRVSPRGEKHFFGGLRFVGIWPLDRVFNYKFRWQDLQLVAGKEVVQFHEEILDYIFVRPDVYFTQIAGAETAPPERYALDVKFLVTIRVGNPRRALFVAPSNWLENVMARLNARFTGWIGTKTFDEILKNYKDPGAVWAEFCFDPLIEMLRDEWGVQVEDNGIQIKEVIPPKEIQDALASQKRQEAEVAGRVAEAAGIAIQAEAQSRGITTEEIKKILSSSSPDVKLQADIAEYIKEYAVRQLGFKEHGRFEFKTEGAGPAEGAVYNAIALLGRALKLGGG